MRKAGKNNINKIRALMAVSMLLLVAFIASWLNAQYKDERQQLKKELETELANVQKDITDSMLLSSFITPIVKETQKKGKLRTEFKVKKGSYNSFIRMEITGDDPDSVTMKKFERTLKSTIKFTPDSPGGVPKGKRVYIPQDAEASELIMKQTMRLLMEEVFHIDSDSLRDAYQLDLAYVRKAFVNKLDQNGQKFHTEWLTECYDTEGSSSRIVLKTTFLSKNYCLGLYDFSTYLVKKMSPQILFSLLLLLVTSAAFLMTIRSLKQQMKLGTIKNDFISNMSHELKTPISTVKVALEALSNFDAIKDPQRTREYLEMAALEMNRLDLLVNQALNTALLEEGKIVIQKECTDLHKLSQEVLQMLQMRFHQHNVDISIETAGEDFTTLLDRLHMQGVLINLIDNSIKYAKEHPVIKLLLENKGDEILLSVKDNGPGIPAEHIKHVFDKFFRVPDGNRHNVKGYGLGLSYAQQITHQHAGRISVRNLNDGGCIFEISIPKTPC